MSQSISAIERNIGIMARNNGVLASMLSELAAGRQATDVRMLLQDTAHIARETGELLLTTQHSLAAQQTGQMPTLVKLGKDFQIILKRFQSLTEQAAKHARSVDDQPQQPAPQPPVATAGVGHPLGSSRDGTLGLHDEDDDDDDEANASERGHLLGASRRDEGGSGSSCACRRDKPSSHPPPPQRVPPPQQRTQQQQQQQQQLQQQHIEVNVLQEREQIITQVETTLGEVGEIFSDLGNLVQEQGTHIDHISSAIENTAHQASRATEELHTASRYQNQRRSRACCLVVALLGAVVLFLVASVSMKV